MATLVVLLAVGDVVPRAGPVIDALAAAPAPASAGAGVAGAGEPQAAPAGRVVVALQLRDCSLVPEQVVLWLRQQGYEPGQVTGVLVGPTREAQAARRVLESQGVVFPLTVRGRRAVTRLLVSAGFTHTPAVLVFDEQGRLTRLLDRDQLLAETEA